MSQFTDQLEKQRRAITQAQEKFALLKQCRCVACIGTAQDTEGIRCVPCKGTGFYVDTEINNLQEKNERLYKKADEEAKENNLKIDLLKNIKQEIENDNR